MGTGPHSKAGERLVRLQKLVDKTGMGIVYGIGPSFQYFSGVRVAFQREHEPAEPSALLLVRPGEEPKMLLDEHSPVAHAGAEIVSGKQQLQASLAKYLAGIPQLHVSRAVEPHISAMIRSFNPGAQFVQADPGEAMRVIKDAEEINTLREAVKLTDQVMARVLPHIRKGITQNELRAMVGKTGLELGAEDTSFPSAALYVKSGTEPTEDPFVYPRDEPLVPGTSIAFDFGFVLDGYCSDFGRSFYCGQAPDHIRLAYRALQESQQELISLMKPGKVRLNQLFGMIEAALDRRGYGDKLRARLKDGALGHQIGVDLHENPWLRPYSDMLLEPGMVMAIEPKLWHSGEYYIRVEDIVLITEDGAESLTRFDRETFELPE